MSAPTPDPASSHTPGGPRRSGAHRARRAGWIGAGVSVVVHVVVLILYGGVAGPPTVSVSRGTPGETDLQGLELLNLAVQDDEEPEDEPQRPDDPEVRVVQAPDPEVTTGEEDEEEPVTVAGETSGAGAPDEEEEVDGRTAAERLRVRSDGDIRLFAPLANEALGRLSPEQILAAELAWRLRGVNDSLASMEQRRADATDWTYTDEDGNRWGVSPGKIHLGSITLPLPFAFGINPGRYEEAQEQAWLDAELSRGAASALVWQSLQERARAIRERRDRERAEERERSLRSRGPRRTLPDSSGVHRRR